MTKASADEILEKFVTGNQDGTLQEVAVVPTPEAAPKAEPGEDAELEAFLKEALALDAAPAAEAKPEEEDLKPLTEEELANLEKSLSEEMLDDMQGGDKAPAVPTEPEADLEEQQGRTLAQGHNQNLKPSEFPDERKRLALQEALDGYAVLEQHVQAVLAENQALKTQLSELTSLNEGLETKLGEARVKIYESAVLSYKTAHVNKLLTEEVTTQGQKQQILEAFHQAQTTPEIKSLYEKYAKDLKKPGVGATNAQKSVADKLNPVFTSEPGKESKQVLAENRTLDPQREKMLKLIHYNYGNK